jgi:hypothetical protein
MANVSNLFPIDLSLVQKPIPLHMPTVSFLLQQPYQEMSEREKRDKEEGKKITRKLNPEETRLYLFLILDRTRTIKIKTEHVIYPSQWDFSKQLKKDKLAGSSEFNKRLLELKDDILLQYQKIIKERPDMPFPQVAQSLKDYGKTKEIPFLNNDKGFFQVLDEFIVSMESEVAEGTIKKFTTLKNSLTEFGKENKKYDTLSFSMIDHEFKDTFTKYLRNQKPRGRQKTRPEGMQFGLLNDTIGKYIEGLKTFCRWAEDRNYNINDTYKEFTNFSKANRKRRKQGHDIVTLTLQELKHFYTFDFSTAKDITTQKDLTTQKKDLLGRVRDLFCFGTYTGQRWSDIERLDRLEIHEDI